MSQNLFPLQNEELANMVDQQPTTTPAMHPGGLVWTRLFGEGDPYDAITWERRDARITKGGGKVVFEQTNIEVPAFWSQTAIDIVASKYFRGKLGTPERETSARQMVDRVADTISGWGFKDGYFATAGDYENFKHDLKFLLINQYAAFNSPVWFNVGVHERPQCSACFILKVEDSMQSILDWYRDEGWIFKYGSGSGTNLSKLRSSKEQLSRGGYSSGPVSFMKGADGVANSIRSGGTTRRAAKMVVLNVDHPDLKDFIYCKKNIEEMTRVLEASGVKNSIEGDLFSPYTLLPYQNANNSVRVTDEFMKAVEEDLDWDFKAVTTGDVIETHKAREVMGWIADAAWHSADPGMQYDTTINDWNTVSNTGRINASNPCSEYMHLDNSACNLASINLLRYLKDDGTLDVDFYKKTIDTMITAQEIIVGNSSYPTPKITQNALDYRELGLGYANLGSLLMNLGLPYDSDEGRAIAGALTSILCGEGYAQSARIAAVTGPFAGYVTNQEPMLNVIKKHGAAAEQLAANAVTGNGHFAPPELFQTSARVWREALDLGRQYGYRNSQATVLAPTGTIAFLMDCNTTGIEPELALVKYKKLVGGGTLKLVNAQVPAALRKLGYNEQQISDIAAYLVEKETVEGAPHIKEEHLPVFDCSFKAANGTRTIGYMGHVKMMGA
ncbi:MAG: vitamin B12-dependent ribonucleotide reductase, partial [bacterium]|nr:vitamin B12-dependent ribonucleotide reductase [bacterium]